MIAIYQLQKLCSITIGRIQICPVKHEVRVELVLNGHIVNMCGGVEVYTLPLNQE
jgi:hypothetical protein